MSHENIEPSDLIPVTQSNSVEEITAQKHSNVTFQAEQIAKEKAILVEETQEETARMEEDLEKAKLKLISEKVDAE